jgi:hypothetical protein
MTESSKILTGENRFSDPVVLTGKFNFSLSGTFTATVTVQRSFDNGASWRDVADFTSPGEYVGDEPQENVLYRFGIKQGGHYQGDAAGRLGQ